MTTKNLELYGLHFPVASLAALAGLSTTGMVTSVLIEVTGVGVFAYQTPAVATPDGKDVIAATDAGGVWIRQTVPALVTDATGAMIGITSGGTGNATGLAVAATNIAGGLANKIPYQTAASTTAFTTPGNSSVLVTSAVGVPSLSTTLPAVTAGAVLVTDPTTSSSGALNTALSNMLSYVHTNSSATGTNNSINSTITTQQVVTGATVTLAAGTYLISYSASQQYTAVAGDIGSAPVSNAHIYNATAAANVAGTTFKTLCGTVIAGTESFGGTASATVIATFGVSTTLAVYVQFATAVSTGGGANTSSATITALKLN